MSDIPLELCTKIVALQPWARQAHMTIWAHRNQRVMGHDPAIKSTNPRRFVPISSQHSIVPENGDSGSCQKTATVNVCHMSWVLRGCEINVECICHMQECLLGASWNRMRHVIYAAQRRQSSGSFNKDQITPHCNTKTICAFVLHVHLNWHTNHW